MRHAPAALLLSALLAGSCRGPSLEPWDARPGPYDQVGDRALERLPALRDSLSEARPELALGELAALLAEQPQSLHLAALLQDAELLELELGGRLPELEDDFDAVGRRVEGDPRDSLRRWYALRAERSGTAVDLVLAARIEDDGLSALRLLDEALEVDPLCIWAHYGRAHVLAELSELAEARGALDQAMELDSGHPRVRRLEPVLLARSSEPKLARRALLLWLDETRDDRRVSALERIDAQLELAELELQMELYNPALGRLNAFAGLTAEQEFRRRLGRSVGLEAKGRYADALAEARAARDWRPQSFRSWVHEALLLEHHLEDERGALQAWRRAAELAGQRSGSGGGGQAPLLGLQARIAVERLTAKLETAGGA